MPASEKVAPGRGLRSRSALLLAFSFAVVAAPVSSVAYAIEAALRALNDDLALLVPIITLVVAIIAVVLAVPAGSAVVAFTLIANLSRALPIISLAAALTIAPVLYGAWGRTRRPRGIRNVAAKAEEIPG